MGGLTPVAASRPSPNPGNAPASVNILLSHLGRGSVANLRRIQRVQPDRTISPSAGIRRPRYSEVMLVERMVTGFVIGSSGCEHVLFPGCFKQSLEKLCMVLVTSVGLFGESPSNFEPVSTSTIRNPSLRKDAFPVLAVWALKASHRNKRAGNVEEPEKQRTFNPHFEPSPGDFFSFAGKLHESLDLCLRTVDRFLELAAHYLCLQIVKKRALT
jgi:hypothetical protein